MKNLKKITSKKEYDTVMGQINLLMKKGAQNITEKELEKLDKLGAVAETWEAEHYKIPLPKSVAGMVELKMFELKMKQKEAAKMMGLGASKLNQILSGKREPDVAFLKAAYKQLNIDPVFLLENA